MSVNGVQLVLNIEIYSANHYIYMYVYTYLVTCTILLDQY